VPDVALGSGNQRNSVPDVAMNTDEQDGVLTQEPFYSSLNTAKPKPKIVPQVDAGGEYAKIHQVRKDIV